MTGLSLGRTAELRPQLAHGLFAGRARPDDTPVRCPPSFVGVRAEDGPVRRGAVRPALGPSQVALWTTGVLRWVTAGSRAS